jgi:hypothetical protein
VCQTAGGLTCGKSTTKINTALKILITVSCIWGSNNLKTTVRIKWLELENK